MTPTGPRYRNMVVIERESGRVLQSMVKEQISIRLYQETRWAPLAPTGRVGRPGLVGFASFRRPLPKRGGLFTRVTGLSGVSEFKTPTVAAAFHSETESWLTRRHPPRWFLQSGQLTPAFRNNVYSCGLPAETLFDPWPFCLPLSGFEIVAQNAEASQRDSNHGVSTCPDIF